jgi:hypothetical protein
MNDVYRYTMGNYLWSGDQIPVPKADPQIQANQNVDNQREDSPFERVPDELAQAWLDSQSIPEEFETLSYTVKDMIMGALYGDMPSPLPTFQDELKLFMTKNSKWTRQCLVMNPGDGVLRIVNGRELCSLTSAVVFTYHVLKCKNQKTINIGRLVSTFPKQRLQAHLFQCVGETAVKNLTQITTLTDSNLIYANITRGNAESIAFVIKCLTDYGVGLVSRFRVYKTFIDGADTLTTLKKDDPFVGYHSMLIIGYREEAGQIYFLLQNWWKDRCFMEVSADYLAVVLANIIFVNRSITSSQQFDLIQAPCALTQVDVPEPDDNELGSAL